MNIVSLLNQVKDGEVVLPAIQRDFVWSEEKITKLLDSIMRGYPIGIALLWETYNDIQHRLFDFDFKSGNLYTFHENTENRKIKLVLDGQQRLQSLYMALYGLLDGKYLYFDVLSGRESDNLAEEKFHFKFATPEEIKKRNALISTTLDQYVGVQGENSVPSFYVKVSDIFKMGAIQKKDFVRELAKKLHLPPQEADQVDINLSRLDDALSKDVNTLKVSTIDENLPPDSPYRKSEADVLEIFVRVNTQGTPLTRSDLIFSMLKLNWKESAEALPMFIKKINEGNSFELDTDFVIRCLFAVSDLGSRFDLKLLRTKSNVAKLRANFRRCCDAIKSTVDFVQRECRCASSRVIGGPNTMVPLVYYLFHTKNHEVRNDQLVNVRKAFFIFAFSKPFSRYADSRIGRFIKSELKPLLDRRDETFPLPKAVSWVKYWEEIKTIEGLLQNNVLLTLHLVQGLHGGKVQYERNAPQTDHIFPRSILAEKGYDQAFINHFANFWILAKSKNQNKYNHPPAEYFKDVDDSVLKQALIDRKLLNYKSYKKFIRKRSILIVKKVEQKLQLSNSELQSYTSEEE
ncbi:MAG: DUF262 domain-containing protein [Candidatus Bathyarchaeota archaeon]|nr:DUF262 domain-containing protein [Candidatus Bathyarchaeota archaeon]